MFTTSRYAGLETRKLARNMAKESGELYVSRGKRTIVQLVEIARKKGEEQISLIEEKNDAPVSIAIIAVNEIGEWNWIGKRLPIKKETD